jgi:hypothetical protein
MIWHSKGIIIDKEKRSVEFVNIICWSNEFVILITSWRILNINSNEIPEVVVIDLSELEAIVSMIKTWSESHTSFLIYGLLEYNVLEMFLSIENIIQLDFVKVRWDLKDDRENLEKYLLERKECFRNENRWNLAYGIQTKWSNIQLFKGRKINQIKCEHSWSSRLRTPSRRFTRVLLDTDILNTKILKMIFFPKTIFFIHWMSHQSLAVFRWLRYYYKPCLMKEVDILNC